MAETTVTIKAKDKTKKAFKSVSTSLKTMKGAIFSAKGAVAGLVGVGGFGLLISSSLKAGDELIKTSDKLGIATKALGGLRHAAELSGVSSNTMDMALQRMTRRLSEAANGTGEAVGALQELGIEAKDIARLSPDKAFQKLSKAMSETSSQGDRVRLAMKLFDTEGVALVNTMAMGEEGLRAAAEEAAAFGTAISEVDARKIEAANDAMLRVQTMVKGIGTTIAVQLSPYITVVAEKLALASKESGGFKDTILGAIKSTVSAIGILGDAIYNIELAWTVVKLGAASALNGIIEGLAWVDRSLSSLLSKMPGLNVPPSADLQIWASASKLAVDDAAKALDEMLDIEKPSEKFNAMMESIATAAEATAQKVQTAKEKTQFGPSDQAALDAEFDAASQHTDDMLRLIEMEVNAKQKQAALEATLLKQKFEVAKGITGNMATLMASSSKKEFQVGKDFAIANALIKGYEAVVSSYAAGAEIGGPWLGAAYAATAAYATKIQIDNIKKQTYSGGGSVSVGGGAGGGISTGSGPAQGTPQSGTGGGTGGTGGGGTTTINVIGKDAVFTTEQVSNMFVKLSEAMNRGDRILFNSDSRQALELGA